LTKPFRAGPTEPVGGPIPEDYVFESAGNGAEVGLSELLTPDTLLEPSHEQPREPLCGNPYAPLAFAFAPAASAKTCRATW
jgi:hypothetical protein